VKEAMGMAKRAGRASRTAGKKRGAG